MLREIGPCASSNGLRWLAASDQISHWLARYHAVIVL
jgi:hypothetical protein